MKKPPVLYSSGILFSARRLPVGAIEIDLPAKDAKLFRLNRERLQRFMREPRGRIRKKSNVEFGVINGTLFQKRVVPNDFLQLFCRSQKDRDRKAKIPQDPALDVIG